MKPDTHISCSEGAIRKCVIHIGTEKTGTTAIQSFLGSERKSLRSQGVLYPKDMPKSTASQWEFVAAVQSEPWRQDVGRAFGIKTESDQTRFRERLRSRLNDELGKSRKIHTLLISSEHFHSRLNSIAQIHELKSFLEHWADEFEVIVYFRRQDEVAVSFQSTRLKSSVQLTDLSLFGDGRGPLKYYDYYDLFQRWAEVFGSDAMKPRIYDPNLWANGSLVQDFAETAGLTLKGSDQSIVNPSLSREGFHFLRAVNRLYPTIPGDSSDNARTQLVKVLSESYIGKFQPISRAEAERFLDQFAESNEALRRSAFPELPSPLFDPDLSAYPETADSIEPDYDDAVRIAVELWGMKLRSQKSQYFTRLGALFGRIRSKTKRR